MTTVPEKQERFIETMSLIRRKKKLTQKDIDLAQKVISRLENGEVDPRLSTILIYLEGIGYDINNLFKEESVMKRPTCIMLDHLNLNLKEEGTCLRYVKGRMDGCLVAYDLRVVDNYVDYSKFGMNVNVSAGFETKVRDFFKEYGVEQLGFVNTVATICAVID